MEAKTNFTDNEVKHLEMTQNIITRMNTNSFQVKGFSVAIVTGLVAYFGVTKNIWVMSVGIFVSTFMWVLDSYFLKQERIFRAIYNDLLLKKTKINLFEFPFESYKEFKYSLFDAMVISINCLLYLILICTFVLLNILTS